MHHRGRHLLADIILDGPTRRLRIYNTCACLTLKAFTTDPTQMSDTESVASAGTATSGYHLMHHLMPVTLIQMTKTGEYVIIGNRKFRTLELQQAFGGTLNPGLAPYKHYEVNPAPLGLAAFAFLTFCLSLYNAQAMGIKVPNVVIGAACFYGGAAQFLAGCWEFYTGNTFGLTALCSYGAFWLSYAAILVPAFGISGPKSGYADAPDQLLNAIGFYLIGWALVTYMLALVTIRSTLAFFLLFLFLAITFTLLGAGELTGKVGVTRAGGVMGVITAIVGWYNAWAGVVTRTNSYITQRPIPMPDLTPIVPWRRNKKE